MSASGQRWWWENSPAAKVHRAMGSDPFAVDHDAVDAEVERVQKHYARTYGRQLTEGESASVRLGAELRSAALQSVRQAPSTTQELVDAVNKANPGAGWYWMPERKPGEGMAMRLNGEWTPGSDPAVIAAAQAREEQELAAAEAEYERWRNGPLVMRTIAKPS